VRLQSEDGQVKWVLFMLGFYVLAFSEWSALLPGAPSQPHARTSSKDCPGSTWRSTWRRHGRGCCCPLARAVSFLGFCLTLLWIAQMIAYMLPPIPLSPFLNTMFVVLDGVFPLFGVAAFALFCGYLLVVAMKVGCHAICTRPIA
jgi:hypothetical protein